MTCKQDRPTLIQIVAVLPPSLSGVGDYALCIARALRENWGIGSQFLVCNPAWIGPREIDGFPIARLESQDPLALRRALMALSREEYAVQSGQSARIALLQLSAYGYQRHGCPFWLARGLENWKQDRVEEKRALITMFHELYAMSAPWRRAFWVSAFQRMALRQIHAVTDVSMTNMAKYAKYLNRHGFGVIGREAVLNTPSNVGEPGVPSAVLARDPRLVVFGSRKSRCDIYTESGVAIRRFVQNYAIEEIIDIGEPLTKTALPEVGCRIKRMGILSPHAVSGELLRCRVGIVSYPTAYLGKSGVYAAYCAHGLGPLVARSRRDHGRSDDRIEEGGHFLDLAKISHGNDWQTISRVAEKAHHWYLGHEIPRHAAHIATAFGKLTAKAQ